MPRATVQIGIRVPPAEKEKWERAAARDKRTLSSLIRVTMTRWLDAVERERQTARRGQ